MRALWLFGARWVLFCWWVHCYIFGVVEYTMVGSYWVHFALLEVCECTMGFCGLLSTKYVFKSLWANSWFFEGLNSGLQVLESLWVHYWVLWVVDWDLMSTLMDFGLVSALLVLGLVKILWVHWGLWFHYEDLVACKFTIVFMGLWLDFGFLAVGEYTLGFWKLVGAQWFLMVVSALRILGG